uniref:Transmembrane protein 42 n=1 Tax=Nothobranchius furzeri TaxID=105023 RepID=A0A8C6NVF3_NOTFU
MRRGCNSLKAQGSAASMTKTGRGPKAGEEKGSTTTGNELDAPKPTQRLDHPGEQLHIPLRLLCGGLLFTCNAVMWTFLAKALRYSSSSTRATVTTTASNFISSAFLGQLIFGEAQITLWWVGISLTFSGLLVLQRVSPQDRHQNAVAMKDE